MKLNWSVFRITVLLYIIVAMLPLNYYFAKHSFDSMQSDGSTMKQLVVLNGAVQRVVLLKEKQERQNVIDYIDRAFISIYSDFIMAPANAEYIELFRAQESFDAMKEAWTILKENLNDSDRAMFLSEKVFQEVNAFSKMTKDMLEYKSETMLDSLYVSLVVTMLFVLSLVFVIRFYIHLQIEKHAIHDSVTGLYNKKYYVEALQKAKLFSVRHHVPLSLIALSINNYDELKKSMNKREFEALLSSLSKILEEFFRQSDTISRIEPNCFVVLAEASPIEAIAKILERLEKDLSDLELNRNVIAKIQIGYAVYDKDSTQSVLDKAKEIMPEHEVVVAGRSL